VESRTGTYWILLDENAPGFYLIRYQVKLSKIQEHVQMLMKLAMKSPPLYAFVDVTRTLENASQTGLLRSLGHHIRVTLCAQWKVILAVHS